MQRLGWGVDADPQPRAAQPDLRDREPGEQVLPRALPVRARTRAELYDRCQRRDPLGVDCARGGSVMRRGVLIVAAIAAVALYVPVSGQDSGRGNTVPRTADGHPDLQGFWTNDSVHAARAAGRVRRQVALHAAGSGRLRAHAARPAREPVAHRHPLRRRDLAEGELRRRTPTSARRWSPIRANGTAAAAHRGRQAPPGGAKPRAAPAAAPPTACRTARSASAASPGATSARRCCRRPTTPTSRSCRRPTTSSSATS